MDSDVFRPLSFFLSLSFVLTLNVPLAPSFLLLLCELGLNIVAGCVAPYNEHTPCVTMSGMSVLSGSDSGEPSDWALLR